MLVGLFCQFWQSSGLTSALAPEITPDEFWEGTRFKTRPASSKANVPPSVQSLQTLQNDFEWSDLTSAFMGLLSTTALLSTDWRRTEARE